MDLKGLAVPFAPEDIEWRVQSCRVRKNGEPWARVLAYVTARAVMHRLDEVCGPENWQVEYDIQETGVLCELSIFVDDRWVRKVDGAEQTKVEAFKGGLSSALKRAGSAWGIGRYLYRLEEGWARCSTDTKTSDEFPYYQKGGKDGDAFTWGPPQLPPWALPSGQPAAPPAKKAKEGAQKAAGGDEPRPLTDAQLRKIGALRRALGLSDEAFKKGLMAHYRVESTRALDRAQASELIERLEAKEKAQLEGEASEAFGGDGRLGKLRAVALGHCDTIGRHGCKFTSGEPVTFDAFGLGADGSLEELREMIQASANEAEMESVIVRLEKTLEDMSF